MIDIHGLVMNETAFVTLLNEEDPITHIFGENESVEGDDDDDQVPLPAKKRGRPAMWEKHPKLVEVVINFIKQHSYSAHVRRRETSGTGTGVTLKQIRKVRS